MEKGLDSFITYLEEEFQLEEVDMRTYSPLTLAYIGDGIYELVIRTLLVNQGNCQTNKLHRRASTLVRASAQAEMIERLRPCLTEEEEQIYKRGRNAKSYTTAKNASVLDYRKATGFEALMGYLYLTQNTKRMMELINLGLNLSKAANDLPKNAKRVNECVSGEKRRAENAIKEKTDEI